MDYLPYPFVVLVRIFFALCAVYALSIVVVEWIWPERALVVHASREYKRVSDEGDVVWLIKLRKTELDEAHRKLDHFRSGVNGLTLDSLPGAAMRLQEINAEIESAHRAYDYARGLAYICGHGKKVDLHFKN